MSEIDDDIIYIDDPDYILGNDLDNINVIPLISDTEERNTQDVNVNENEKNDSTNKLRRS